MPETRHERHEEKRMKMTLKTNNATKRSVSVYARRKLISWGVR